MVEDRQNRACKVHNARFYTLAPRAVNYLAYNRAHSQLALARLVNTHLFERINAVLMTIKNDN